MSSTVQKLYLIRENIMGYLDLNVGYAPTQSNRRIRKEIAKQFFAISLHQNCQYYEPAASRGQCKTFIFFTVVHKLCLTLETIMNYTDLKIRTFFHAPLSSANTDVKKLGASISDRNSECFFCHDVNGLTR